MRVLVVDDIQLVRERLVAVIAAIPGIEFVAQAAAGDEMMTAIAAVAPDVVVFDIRIPAAKGFKMLSGLACVADAPRDIVFSDDVEWSRQALKAGARFFFDKSTELGGLAAALGELAAEKARRPS